MSEITTIKRPKFLITLVAPRCTNYWPKTASHIFLNHTRSTPQEQTLMSLVHSLYIASSDQLLLLMRQRMKGINLSS